MIIDPQKARDGYNMIIREINRPHPDLREIAHKVLEVIVDVFEADRADIAIIREDFDIDHMDLTEDNSIRIRAFTGYTPEEWDLLVRSGVVMESIHSAILTRESRIFSDTDLESPERAAISRSLGNGCWMNYVLVMEDRAVANVHLAKREKFHFQMEELRQLEYMSQLLATAINIAGLWEKERMLTLEFIDSLNAALEVRDKYTAGHVERVKLYAELIATAMGLPPEEIEYIRTAAILHDLGKIGVPDAILKKAGSLSEEERQAIQSHVLMTDEILKKLSYFDKARELARYHHEAFDGGGYVLGIQGEGIPLGARIIAVSDAFDAMTSERAYRRPFYVEEAVEILRDPAITQWDQNIVRVFLSLIKTDQFRLRAVKEGLICLEEGKYCRDSSALKFKRYASFFAQGPEGQ